MHFKKITEYSAIVGVVICIALFASCKSKGGNNGSLALLALGGADAPPASLDTPTGIAASGNRTDGVTVSWNAVSRARFYYVYRSDSESGPNTVLGENNTASYEDPSTEPGKKYYYRVTAGWRPVNDPDTEVLSDQSGPDEGHTILASPAGVAASTDSAAQVTVTWSSVAQAITYKVLRSASQTGSFAELASGISGNEYQDAGAVAGTRYYYQVIAYSASDIAGLGSDTVQGYKCTGSPGNFSASDGTYYSYVKLTWDAAASTTGYEIYRGATLLTTTSATSYNDAGAAAGEINQYKVVAVHTNGGKSLPAQDSGNRLSSSITIPCTVSWTPNREKAVNSINGGYRLYYSTSHIPATGFEGVTHVDIPYVSGSWAPTSKTLDLGPGAGTWYIRVTGYSGLNGGSASQPSTETSVVIY